MQPTHPFFSAASNAILKPDGLLKWKMRLVKDARLLLPLTEVMKIAKLTSPLPDLLRLSSPSPRLRHGRRLALLSHPSLTLNLYILFFALSQAPLHPEESHLSFCSPFSPTEYFAAASNLSSATATGPDKVAYPMLKHLPCSGMDFFFTFSIFPGLCIPFLPSGRHLLLFPSTRWESPSTLLLPSGLSLSPLAYQSCLNA